MTVSVLFGCCQIETCVADLAAARACLADLADAVPVEQELARQIAGLLPGTGYDVEHLELGGAVIQMNQPAPGMKFDGQKSIHQAYLDEGGPCVTNLNFYIDDIAHARELLTGMGAPIHLSGPSTVVAALGDYGPENTRADAADRPFLFLGTRFLLGFDLELMEPNFLCVSRQSVQFPAFLEPRPAPRGELILQRLVAVVPDLAATWDAITRIFAPASRSKPYLICNTSDGASFRVGLGGIEIEYRQPKRASGSLADYLRRRGPGFVSIVLGHPRPAERAARNDAWQRLVLENGREAEGIGTAQARFFALTAGTLGFDIVLEGLDPTPG